MKVLFIIITIIILFILSYWYYTKRMNLESFSNFQDCRNKGFTREFCQVNPYPNICQCSDGSIGRLIPGFKGRCLCNTNNVNQLILNNNLNKFNSLREEQNLLPKLVDENNVDLSKYIKKESLLSYFYPKRSWLTFTNIIPYHRLNNGSFY